MEEKTHKNSSSTLRFLGLIKPPDSDSPAFELDESDVVWSGDYSDSIPSTDSSPNSTQISPTASRLPSAPKRRHHHSYRPERFGLSAALADERCALVQRKAALDPSLSATSAARTIPPVPIPRSSSGSDDFSGNPIRFLHSAPVNVPLWSKANQNQNHRSAKLGLFDEGEEEPEEEMLPPHEIVARSHMTTFSVVEGVGRTLKGRDLRRVRNAIWQKTGFLD